MNKFYAVKHGKVNGIYRNWEECKKQVIGFPGAIYKSFKSEKEAQLYIKPKEKKEIKLPIIEIYTDGSHQPSKNFLGLGAYCKYDDMEYKMSFECNKELLKQYNIESEDCSNPTAEFLGFSEVLKEFSYTSGYHLRFYIDYKGVGCWIRGEWECKEPYIKKIKDKCKLLMDNIDCEVEIIHIYGHSGIKGNDEADILAKVGNGCNTFPDLMDKLTEYI